MAVDSIETLFSKTVSHHKSRYIFRVTANKNFVQGSTNAVHFGAQVFSVVVSAIPSHQHFPLIVNVDNAARIHHIVGGLQDTALVQYFTMFQRRQLVVSGACDNRHL